MCGACGGAGPDWSLPFVSGVQRRSSIAKFLTAICRGVAVGTMSQGWTVRTATGGWSVARTLDELVEATARRAVCTSWPDVQAVVRARSSADGGAAKGGHARPASVRPFRNEDDGRLAVLGAVAEPVLPEGDLHLRLTGFVLGVRAFERGPVAIDILDGGSSRRLVGAEGRVLGLVGQSLTAHALLRT
ncbi:hypothetical protein [Ruania zhangjianzhongii]|uniref:hypothetical protein n=1 Tax=Ruania zhangjianzhongii TaxID=2603206 RepID=UPI0011CACF97|nr:hypothetical protein [Ruania zhangjianzhongii]